MKKGISMLHKIFFTATLFFLISTISNAQLPSFPQKNKSAIVHARIHVGNGDIIEDGTVVFEKGKILYVGTDALAHPDAKDRLDARGAELYPGFIALGTGVGLEEISQVKATLDIRELGRYNPNLRTLIAYNTDSRVIPTLRSNGVLTAQVAPEGGVISGQSSVFKMDGWNWEDAVLEADEAIWLNWPQMQNQGGWWAEPERSSPNDQYRAELDGLVDYFRKARAYHEGREAEKLEIHLGYEAMKGLWTGKKKLFVRVGEAKAMMQCVQVCESLGLKPVLFGAADAWKIADFLKEKSIPVVLQKTHSLPSRTDEDVWQTYKTPALLKKAGVLFAISQSGFWEQRNLAFQAGHTIGHGMSKEDALQSITLDAARILGLENRMGSIERGKDATFFISSGDALDMRGQNLSKAYILGSETDLNDMHKQLYKKYQTKYGQSN